MFSPRLRIYIVYGAIVWMVASVAYYPATVVHPLHELAHPSKALAVFFLMTLWNGECLAAAIYFGLEVGDLAISNTTAHIGVPLIAPFMLGPRATPFSSPGERTFRSVPSQCE
jgi:hypothetical protein